MNQQEPSDAMAEREDILKHLVDDSIAKEAFVPHSGKTLDGRVRLVIDFPCAIDAIGWLAEAKGSWLVPDDVTLYQTDALDEIKGSNVLIVRRRNDRPDTLMVHTRTVSEEGV